MGIEELYNPSGIQKIIIKKTGNIVECRENQGFQEYPKSIELWEDKLDGRIFRIQRWLKKSISLACYSKKIILFEDIRPHIKPKL